MRLNILSTIKIVAQVHHIRNRNIGRKASKPDDMVQRRDISIVS